ncbi:MAG: hypothetical protein ACO3K7_06415 [Candidatus Marinamargulisbacteria bacterium]
MRIQFITYGVMLFIAIMIVPPHNHSSTIPTDHHAPFDCSTCAIQATPPPTLSVNNPHHESIARYVSIHESRPDSFYIVSPYLTRAPPMQNK